MAIDQAIIRSYFKTEFIANHIKFQFSPLSFTECQIKIWAFPLSFGCHLPLSTDRLNKTNVEQEVDLVALPFDANFGYALRNHLNHYVKLCERGKTGFIHVTIKSLEAIKHP